MASQLTYLRNTCTDEIQDDEPIDDADCLKEKIQTTAILFEFLETTAERDGSLTYRDRIRMRGEVNECIRLQMQQTTGTVNQITCTDRVVQLLTNYGDEFEQSLRNDSRLNEATSIAMEATDSDSPWLARVGSHLKDVIELYFNADEDGNTTNVTLGGICAIFLYCYRICKEFVLQHPRETIIPWLIDLAVCLMANLAKAKFYEWLEEHGGWLKAVAGLLPSNSLSKAILSLNMQQGRWPNNLYLVAGVTLIGVWAYNRYIKS